MQTETKFDPNNLPKITAAQIIQEVRKLAEASPDNVYQLSNGLGCFYGKGQCTNESTGCIFGQAFTNLGIPGTWLDDNTIGQNSYIYEILDWLQIPHTSQESQWCGKVQSEQDYRVSWKIAVENADKYCQL